MAWESSMGWLKRWRERREKNWLANIPMIGEVILKRKYTSEWIECVVIDRLTYPPIKLALCTRGEVDRFAASWRNPVWLDYERSEMRRTYALHPEFQQKVHGPQSVLLCAKCAAALPTPIADGTWMALQQPEPPKSKSKQEVQEYRLPEGELDAARFQFMRKENA